MTAASLDAAPTLPTLRGVRVQLRWLVAADVAALFEIFSNAEVTRYWSAPPLRDQTAAVALLADIHEHFARRTLFQWGIARVADDRVIGTATLARISWPHKRAELGYALGREYWGQGFVAEALPIVLSYAFDELGLHRLEADVDPRNAPSIRVLERLGFQREGHQRERYHMMGEIQDAVLFGLLRSEWKG